VPVADVVERVLAGERGDFVREAVRLIAEELMGAEISPETGAARGKVFAGGGDRSRRLSPGHTTNTYLTRVTGVGAMGSRVLTPA
jgi:hypothetical protein